ncbi:D-alanyl-D-alanine carboxypeptidase, partial [Streptomyces hirsutus]|uniref:D-alanyl-D-alanine carboxypeptidase n=1 Tax=Streptomyces hirsutus TaxID=35620 RepID=UPI003D15F51F
MHATPGDKPGDRPRTTVTPANHYVYLDVRATTVDRGGPSDLTVERQHGAHTVTVSGTLPVGGATAKEWISVWEPTGYAADVFRDALAAHGVRVTGATRLGEATPQGAHGLATHESTPLNEPPRVR